MEQVRFEALPSHKEVAENLKSRRNIHTNKYINMNFILRVHTESNLEYNSIIGDRYKVIRKDDNKKEFDAQFKEYFGVGKNDLIESHSEYDQIFAFIGFAECTEQFALRHVDNIYIMTETGATFTKLTTRKRN